MTSNSVSFRVRRRSFRALRVPSLAHRAVNNWMRLKGKGSYNKSHMKRPPLRFVARSNGRDAEEKEVI